MKISTALLVFMTLTLLGAIAWAASEQEAEDITRIMALFPDLSTDEIRPSPIEGIYEISLGARMAYISADGQYLIQGDLYDVETEQNLTEERRMAARVRSLDDVSESSMIIFGDDDAARTITVFTDIDCGYCRKLHREMASYNENGIRVRYLFFPRSGPETSSWFKAEEVWCADDRNSALTNAKAGAVIESEDCGATPVAQHYELGRTFGISGTPAIVADSGVLIPGYVSANELLQYLDE